MSSDAYRAGCVAVHDGGTVANISRPPHQTAGVGGARDHTGCITVRDDTAVVGKSHQTAGIGIEGGGGLGSDHTGCVAVRDSTMFNISRQTA